MSADATTMIRDLLRKALAGHGQGVLEVARVAQLWSAEEVATALAAGVPPVPPEMLRALAIELALRGKSVSIDGKPFGPIAAVRDPRTPPMSLLAIESKLPPRTMRFGGPGSFTVTLGPREIEPRPYEPLEVADMLDVTTDVDRGEIAAAVASWAVGSNGVIEAKRFLLEGARGTHATVGILHRASLASAPPDDAGLIVTHDDPSDAFALLFTAAHGGAYNGPRLDSAARDLAWASLRAIVGCDANATIEEVERRASACHFVSFTGTPFFYGVAWDIGLAVVTPERDGLAVLAATDTD